MATTIDSDGISFGVNTVDLAYKILNRYDSASAKFKFTTGYPAGADFIRLPFIAICSRQDSAVGYSAFIFTKEGGITKICGNGTLTLDNEIFTLASGNDGGWGQYVLIMPAQYAKYVTQTLS